jgi:hypothetical protein
VWMRVYGDPQMLAGDDNINEERAARNCPCVARWSHAFTLPSCSAVPCTTLDAYAGRSLEAQGEKDWALNALV